MRSGANSLGGKFLIGATVRVVALVVLGLVASGCGGGRQGSSTIAPGIILQPAAQTVSAGLTATFTVMAGGTPPFTYQWYRDGSAIPGANDASYVIATAAGDDGATFSVSISNGAGTVRSAPVVLTVASAALQSISVTPSSSSIPKGATKQFSALGTYTDTSTHDLTTSVTWDSGTTAVATIAANTGLALGTGTGSTQITAAQGKVVSTPVTLAVTAAVLRSIALTPPSASIARGDTQQFAAAGTYSDGSIENLTTAVLWESAETSVATIGAATGLATGAAVGASQITAAQGSIVSLPANLTVTNTTPRATRLACSSLTPPYRAPITLVPTFSGGTAVIGSAGAGSSDITVAAVSGGSYPTLALTAANTYTLTVTGTGGDVDTTSCSATPTDVTISSISPSGIVMGPGALSFAASVSGGATNNVTWTATGGSFSGDQWTSPNAASTYTITATSVDKPTVSLSTPITISAPVVTVEPVSHNLCPTTSTQLSVAANYADSYQWRLNGTPIVGATNSTYTIASAAPRDAGDYTAAVTNAAATVISNAAKIVVGSSITKNPQSLTIFETQTATFSVAADGQAPFTYQWYEIPSGSSTGQQITGANASAYTTPAVDNAYSGAQYYVTLGDTCGGTPLVSSNATLTVNSGNVPPTITTQPVGQNVAVGGATAFSVVAAGTPALTYQWYRVPAGQSSGSSIPGATTASYSVLSGETATGNDQDVYYVIVTNPYGQAVSQRATLAVGDGILIQITGQPQTVYLNAGAPATFSVTASSLAPLSYQWYRAEPGSSTFHAIEGATSATYLLDPTAGSDSGAVFRVAVRNGSTASVTSQSAALFVGPLSVVDDLCDTNWTARGDALELSGCKFQLTASSMGQHGEIVWPTLIATGNIQLSFTVEISNPSSPPADGFAMVLGDPSLGATPSSTGASGQGMGARGIPGFVLGFDTYNNEGDPSVPYLGVGRGEDALWENPWLNVNTNISALAAPGQTISHDYTVSIVQGTMTVTMDGSQVFSGNVTVPPVAYLYVTASTGGSWEKTVIGNLSATVAAPSN